MTRFTLSVLATSALACAAIVQPAQAQEQSASQFIDSAGQRVFSILGDEALTLDQKKERLSAAVDELFDVQYIGSRVYGAGNWRSSDLAQRRDFIAAYRDYAVSEYEQYLDSYSGQTMTVTGEREAARATIVDAELTNPDNDEVIRLRWFVAQLGNDGWRPDPVQAGEWRVQELVVNSTGGEVSLLTQQRENIASMRALYGGSNSALIDALRREVETRNAAAQAEAVPSAAPAPASSDAG